jgi:KaiC/GvpD/RAD55 family RecA-like ATPase
MSPNSVSIPASASTATSAVRPATAVSNNPPRPADARTAVRSVEPHVPLRPVEARLSTGERRLDALLDGGYSPGSATLFYGPPFCGKQQLQRQGILAAAASRLPVTVVLHTVGANALSRRLRSQDPAFAEAEESGLVAYIDVHSKAQGEPTDHPHTTYVSDPSGVHDVVRATNARHGASAGLLAIESASTVFMTLGATKAFTYLRTVLGRTLNAGGFGLLCLEAGMHPESEVQLAKHLCAGMVEMRKKGETYLLHIEGLDTAFARPGWVEYEFNNRSFRLVGSFASRSIR